MPSKLCPDIYRQRGYIEGIYTIDPPDAVWISGFLRQFSKHMAMTPIAEISLFSPDDFSELHHGIGGFVPWAESGCSIYTWSDRHLFTVELYSCKPFDLEFSARLAGDLFQANQLYWYQAE